MAPLVDAVLGDQLTRLAARLNAPREAPTVEMPATRPMLEGR
jgi:hypothetical protein